MGLFKSKQNNTVPIAITEPVSITKPVIIKPVVIKKEEGKSNKKENKKIDKKKQPSNNQFKLSDYYIQLSEFLIVVVLIAVNYFAVNFIINPHLVVKLNPADLQESTGLNQTLFTQIQKQRENKIIYNSTSPVPTVNINSPF